MTEEMIYKVFELTRIRDELQKTLNKLKDTNKVRFVYLRDEGSTKETSLWERDKDTERYINILEKGLEDYLKNVQDMIDIL